MLEPRETDAQDPQWKIRLAELTWKASTDLEKCGISHGWSNHDRWKQTSERPDFVIVYSLHSNYVSSVSAFHTNWRHDSDKDLQRHPEWAVTFIYRPMIFQSQHSHVLWYWKDLGWFECREQSLLEASGPTCGPREIQVIVQQADEGSVISQLQGKRADTCYSDWGIPKMEKLIHSGKYGSPYKTDNPSPERRNRHVWIIEICHSRAHFRIRRVFFCDQECFRA